MSREIKFRAWDGTYKKMRYKICVGNLNDEENYTAHSVYLKPGDTDYKIERPGQWMNFDEHSDYILMQYTGLKDKNGKEIYEGDIVEVDNSEIEENGEFDVTTVCKWDNGCFILEDYAGGHWTRQLFHKPHRLTIIGNIYENPDFLTEEEKQTIYTATELYAKGKLRGKQPANEPTAVKGDDETFEDYMRNTRDRFVIEVREQEWNVKLRVTAEDLLICFDQMRDKLTKAAPKGDDVKSKQEITNYNDVE